MRSNLADVAAREYRVSGNMRAAGIPARTGNDAGTDQRPKPVEAGMEQWQNWWRSEFDGG
jgi:hypothetical protein